MPSFDNSPQDGAAKYCDKRVCFDSDSSLALDYCARYQVSVCTYAHLSVCVYVFVCPRSHLRNYTSDLHQIFMRVTYGRGSVLLWRRSDTLCTSGFMDGIAGGVCGL